MHLLLGGDLKRRWSGCHLPGVVIETDGAIEQVDTLKAAYHGAPQTGLHVPGTMDAALLLPGVVARQLGERALSGECRTCRIRKVCGGGLYADRYRSGQGLRIPLSTAPT